MKLSDLFKNNKNDMAALDEATEARLLAAMEKGDVAAVKNICAAEKINPDARLRNGETLITHAIKTVIRKYEAHGKACVAFREADDGFHQNAEMLRGMGADIKASAQLSSVKLLAHLKIPREQWPRAMVNDKFIAVGRAQGLAASYADTLAAYAVVNALGMSRNVANARGETRDMLLARLQKTQQTHKPAIERTHAALRTAEEAAAATKDLPDARTFIGYARDEKLKNAFPWLAHHKPSETEFLDALDPGWEERQRDRAEKIAALKKRLDKNETDDDDPKGGKGGTFSYAYTLHQRNNEKAEEKRRKETLYAEELGFYKWQTPSSSAAYILEQNRTQREAVMTADERARQIEELRQRLSTPRNRNRGLRR